MDVEDLHDLLFCGMCKSEPSIAAAFYFENSAKDFDLVFHGNMEMRTDSGNIVLRLNVVCILPVDNWETHPVEFSHISDYMMHITICRM